MTQLPDYVVLNDEACEKRRILTKPSQTLTFPLTPEDLEDIKILEAKNIIKRRIVQGWLHLKSGFTNALLSLRLKAVKSLKNGALILPIPCPKRFGLIRLTSLWMMKCTAIMKVAFQWMIWLGKFRDTKQSAMKPSHRGAKKLKGSPMAF